MRRTSVSAAALGLWVLAGCSPTRAAGGDPSALPNIVVILADDMGWGDAGPFGETSCTTPHLDRMAAEGRTFTNFYVSCASCSASRASLLTGCYNQRIGVRGAFGAKDPCGLNPDEVTLAEICKQRGYRTAIFGKWHLGRAPEFLPPAHGFDEYFGVPYSHDMRWDHPSKGHRYNGLPLIEGDRVVDQDLDPHEQARLTIAITERAREFIVASGDRPFFLFLSHVLPHVPLRIPREHAGTTAGPYADAIAAVDASVGVVLDTLRAEGLAQHTLVFFTSDNGPWLNFGEHAGSPGPLREGKGTSFDGGVRAPTLAWWPGEVPAATVCDTPAMTIDLLPTIAARIGAQLPEHPIDGRDIWPLVSGAPGAVSPQEAYFFYRGPLEAVRSGRWKLHLPHSYRTLSGRPGGVGGATVPYDIEQLELSLYDLEADPGETTNVAADHPEIVARLEALADEIRADIGRHLGKPGPGCREVGRVTGSRFAE